MLMMVADGAAQRCHQEQRDFVGVVDLGQRIHHSHEARGAHQRRRSHAPYIGAGAKSDRRFLAVDRDMDEPIVAFHGLDDIHDPVIGQAGDELYAAGGQFVGDQLSDSNFFAHAVAALLCQSLRRMMSQIEPPAKPSRT